MQRFSAEELQIVSEMRALVGSGFSVEEYIEIWEEMNITLCNYE